MILHYLSIVCAVLLLLYHQATTCLPLFPWNDIKKYSRKQIWLEAGTNGILMGLGVISLIIHYKGFLYYYPLCYYPFLFTGEFMQWWLPYFSKKVSKSKLNIDYETYFSRTTKFIQPRPGRVTPDANHIVLHLITLVTLVLVYISR